jgi:hypothetical protein
MRIIKVATPNGIDDIKIIGETEQERLFIKQLAEAGTLTSLSREVGDSIVFRAISVSSELGTGYYSSTKNIGKYDFAIRQNENHLVDLKFDKQDGPIDLTDYAGIKLQVKLRKGSAAIFEVSIGAGLEVAGIDNNILKVAFSAAQTILLDCDTYYYDVLLQKTISNVYYLEGKISVIKSTTR